MTPTHVRYTIKDFLLSSALYMHTHTLFRLFQETISEHKIKVGQTMYCHVFSSLTFALRNHQPEKLGKKEISENL